MNILFGILAVVSAVYYGMIISYAGLQASFSLFWLALAVVSGALAAIFSMKRFHIFLKGLPQWIKVPLATTIVLAVLCFAVVEGLVVFHMAARPKQDADYLIVLGAQVRGETITKSLRYRLDAAFSYLEENPDTKVIVTGGKGPGENIPEAVAMREYLLEKGIKKERILMERYATNTKKNMVYSKALIGDTEASVVVVTNGFHVFRSVSIAKKIGLEHVSGLSARSDGLLLPNYMIREFFAVVKDKIMGNI